MLLQEVQKLGEDMILGSLDDVGCLAESVRGRVRTYSEFQMPTSFPTGNRANIPMPNLA